MAPTDGGSWPTNSITTALNSGWGPTDITIYSSGTTSTTTGGYTITYTDNTGWDHVIPQPTKCPRCRIIHYASQPCIGWDSHTTVSLHLGDVLKSELGIDPEWAQLIMEESSRLGRLRDAEGKKGQSLGERVCFYGEKPRWEVENPGPSYWRLWIEKLKP